jgi:cytochrome c oxidase assembly protein subunit 11
MATEPTPSIQDYSDKNKRTSKVLIVVIVVMFLFGFASIPLYRIFCEAVDPGGSTASNGTVSAYEGVQVDPSRKLRIRLATNVNKQLPWEFKSMETRVELNPGERKKVEFYAKNIDMLGSVTGRAVYDINPPEAGQYFKKIECFCFQEQELAAGEDITMPLIFWFEPDIPADIEEITVSYTFFNMDSSRERTLKNRERTVQ